MYVIVFPTCMITSQLETKHCYLHINTSFIFLIILVIFIPTTTLHLSTSLSFFLTSSSSSSSFSEAVHKNHRCSRACFWTACKGTFPHMNKITSLIMSLSCWLTLSYYVQGKVEVPLPMHIGINESANAGPGDCHIKGGYIENTTTWTVKLANVINSFSYLLFTFITPHVWC